MKNLRLIPIKKLVTIVLLMAAYPVTLDAQQFTLEAVTSYPFPSDLTSSATGSRIAVAINLKGQRNIYVAEGPSFALRKLTAYDHDEGQELTSVCLTPDGRNILFVRGGDHGAFDERVPRNPGGMPTAPKVQLYSIPYDGGLPLLIDEGDNPVVHPEGKYVAYVKNGQAWMAAIDGSAKPFRLFYARGSTSTLQWSPDGSRLLFVSSRGAYSFVGIFKDSLSPVQWVAPDFARVASPRWTRDGKKIVFAQTNARGGAPDSITIRKPNPWSLHIADVANGTHKLLWQSPNTVRGSVPSTHGRYNIQCAADGRIIFMSHQDGWGHLYAIDTAGGKPLQLTTGKIILEHITMAPDGTYLLASANAGNDKEDRDRRHLVKVITTRPGIEVLTPGNGIETFPVVTGDGSHIVYISASAQLPGLVTVMDSRSKSVLRPGEALLPEAFPAKMLVTPKSIQFKAADGLTVYGQLFTPANATGKMPAVVFVHGGPSRQMLVGWHYGDYYSNTYALNQYLANQGFVVLAVNYRLGIGYGHDFQHPAKAGEYGASEYLDVKAAGEWLAKQPDVDRSSIGVYGGSYGGFLTALAIGKDSKLFAAGADIHGVHNFLNGFPGPGGEQAPDAALARKIAWESSPVAWVDGMKSPMLFIHGDDDGNVEVEESIDLIRRFQQKGKTYESLMIPDETHHWMRYENMVRVDQAVADFLIRKLKKR